MSQHTRAWRFRPIATRYLNPITRRFAGYLPGFALLTYRGRKSGRVHQLPVNVFRYGDTYFFALTYGSASQWVRNVVAEGGCGMRRLGRTVRLTTPEIIVDPTVGLVPGPVRPILRGAGVTEFLRMRAAPAAPVSATTRTAPDR